jgi:excinuclease ABC subunit A
LPPSPRPAVRVPTSPRAHEPTPQRTSAQIAESLLTLPAGTVIELRAPVSKLYDAPLEVLFKQIRKQGCRHVLIDGDHYDLSDEVELEEEQVTDIDM